MLEDFERQNSVGIVLTGQLVHAVSGVDLRWTALAYDGDPDLPGVTYSASASVRCSATRLVRMEDVILNLLYVLDSQLAESEFMKVGIQKA